MLNLTVINTNSLLSQVNMIMTNVKLNLSGFTCDSCSRNVTNIFKVNNYVDKVMCVDLMFAEVDVYNISKEALDTIIENIVLS